MAETTVDAIREAARELIATAGITAPPVDLAAVAGLQGITKIGERKMRSTLGTLREGRNGLTVTLNKREPFRARFTLAHEIGHTMVDPPDRDASTVLLATRKPRRKDDLERLCDQIAVELLMPYELFLAALGPGPLAIADVFRLARLFDASLQSTALRAGELALEPVEVVCWQRDGVDGIRPGARRGHEFLAAPATEANRHLDDGTPVARAFTSKDTERGRDIGDLYDCEARGFLRGSARFVISIARPARINRTGQLAS